MDLYLLAELKTVALKITTVDMLKPPPDFRWNPFNTKTKHLVQLIQSFLHVLPIGPTLTLLLPQY